MQPSRALGLSLLAHYRDRQPAPDHFDMIDDLKRRVKEAAAHASNKPQFEFFGSNKSGFCAKGADADLSFTFRSYSAQLHGIPKFEEQNSKKMVRLSQALVEGGFSRVKYVEARIPVVSFIDEATGIHADVTIGNVGGVQNSAILRRLRDLHPVVPMYIHVVKEWAKSKEVIAPEKSCFNSFTVTTMAMMVLQELGVIPVFSLATGPGGILTLEDVERHLKDWKLPPIYEVCKSDDDVCADALHFLLSKFAEYYANFDVKTGTVSLMLPRRLRPLYLEAVNHHMRWMAEDRRPAWEKFYKENNLGPVSPSDFEAALRSERIQRPHDAPVVVEDFVNFVNCGRRLTAARMEPVFGQFKALHAALSGGGGAAAGAAPTTVITTAEELFKSQSRLSNTHANASASRRVRSF